MAQHYSNPAREHDTYALPDLETFQAHHANCPECGALVQSWDCTTGACPECQRIVKLTESGWFYWTCFPGCMPDSDPMGPFDTEEAALADAREHEGYAIDGSDEE